MGIDELYNIGARIQNNNYIENNSKIDSSKFSLLLNSSSSSEVFSNLQKKFNQVNFHIGDISKNDKILDAYGSELRGRLNVIISPSILNEMENSISKRLEIENRIFEYINEKNTWFEGLGVKSLSSGIIINSDGTVSYWSIPEDYEIINDNSQKQSQPSAVYRGENYRGEYEASSSKNKGDILVEKRFNNENIIPLYYLGTYSSKEIINRIIDKSNKEQEEKNLLQHLKEKFSGINIYILEIENKDEAIINHGIKCKSLYNVCISPIIFKEMEEDPAKELEIEGKISDYLFEETQERNLYKFLNEKTKVSGIVFHKDRSVTRWSNLNNEKDNLENVSKIVEVNKEFIIRQTSVNGKFSIRKLIL
ncbi:DUF6033 family protein [Clostridium sp. C2-6-12]|uniref:DUF6033 family protein n=1 Tax=Clostridium sp. C2-6-12 TaxID=2698832 RepID=UPI00136F9562|nr:DUF6033 family protein [Clostridium sp. C2-6-12]